MSDPTTEALIAECEALRLRAKLAEEQADHYRTEAVRLGDLARRARAENEETDSLNVRLSKLLADIGAALKGPPAPGVWHDWSELPTWATNLAAKATHLQGEIEQLLKEPDQPD